MSFLVKLTKTPPQHRVPLYVEVPEVKHYYFMKVPGKKIWLFYGLVERHKKSKSTEDQQDKQKKAKALNLGARRSKIAPRSILTANQHQATYEYWPRTNLQPDGTFLGYYPEDHIDVQTHIYWHYERFGCFPKYTQERR
jgi:hypothetical protein